MSQSSISQIENQKPVTYPNAPTRSIRNGGLGVIL